MKKAKARSLSNKAGLKEIKAKLPVKGPEKPAIPEPIKVEVQGPIKQEPGEQEQLDALIGKIKATGLLRGLFCNTFNLSLRLSKRSLLTQEEKETLEAPLDEIERRFLEKLPEWLRKQVENGSPLIDLAFAVCLIVWAKNQEIKAKAPEKPVQDPIKPDKPVVVDPTAPLPEKPPLAGAVIDKQ